MEIRLQHSIESAINRYSISDSQPLELNLRSVNMIDSYFHEFSLLPLPPL